MVYGAASFFVSRESYFEESISLLKKREVTLRKGRKFESLQKTGED